MDDLLDGLNDSQRRAVTHGEGPLLVVAGPGSGKTRVVSRRVAWILRQGARPSEVLAVTFTNKAAAELRERVARLAPASGLWVATFHAACARILRENHEAAGLPAHFTIYDEEDRRRLAGRVLRERNIPADRLRPAAVLRRISDWKTAGKDPREAAADAWMPAEKEMASVYAAVEDHLRADGAVDFDDLLLRAHRLLETDPAVLARYRERLRWVLVDEYQDTNRIQFLLARALASGSRNLCATGDPDQSIYRWRGADIANILDFEKHYPDATVVRLERNYRSTDAILGAAGRLIRHNRDRREKDLVGGGLAGPALRVEIFADADAEGDGVAAAVEEALAAGTPASGVAVLYRVNARSRAVEHALRRRRIPYQVVRGVEFYQRAEVKDLLCWLRVLANPRDGEALARALHAPRRGAGDAAVQAVLDEAARRGIPARDALLLGAESLAVGGRAAKALDGAAEILRSLLALDAASVALLLQEIVERTGYRRWLEEHWREDHQERWENVTELLAAAEAHDQDGEGAGGLGGFLEEAALVSDQDRYDEEVPRVSLMTLHACKGLEFPAVFLVGVEEGVLPHAMALRGDFGGEDRAALEEERRLLFVGMTRAMRSLWLSAGLRPAGWTGGGGGPSRFLAEIGLDGVRRTDRAGGGDRGGRGGGWGAGRRENDPARDPDPWDLGDRPARAPWRRERGPASPARRDPSRALPDRDFSFDPDPVPGDDGAGAGGVPLRVGLRVRHAKFGTGRVRRLERRGGSVRATVEFRIGVKTLDLDFTSLEPLGDEP